MELGEAVFAEAIYGAMYLVLFSYLICKGKWCACGMLFFQHLQGIKYESPGAVEEQGNLIFVVLRGTHRLFGPHMINVACVSFTCPSCESFLLIDIFQPCYSDISFIKRNLLPWIPLKVIRGIRNVYFGVNSWGNWYLLFCCFVNCNL
jgi:hypothetical protein